MRKLIVAYKKQLTNKMVADKLWLLFRTNIDCDTIELPKIDEPKAEDTESESPNWFYEDEEFNEN